MAIVVDTCDIQTGEVLQVTAEGDAEIYQLDPARARRKLRRYLGSDESCWPARFTNGTFEDPDTRLIRLEPTELRARTLSWDRRPDPDDASQVSRQRPRD